jgi:mannitol/fructose-specific phosphotransferase system IIA component (Ntr-type)
LAAEGISAEILKREELGSTGTGGGVAIPHARIQGLNKSFGILARLTNPSILKRSIVSQSILCSYSSFQPTQ